MSVPVGQLYMGPPSNLQGVGVGMNGNAPCSLCTNPMGNTYFFWGFIIMAILLLGVAGRYGWKRIF